MRNEGHPALDTPSNACSGRARAVTLLMHRYRVGPYVMVVAGAGVIVIPALTNGFPFLFPDTADYLIFTPRLYRSPFYGLFIFFFHWNRFVWAPVLAQALIVSHVIWVMVRIYAGHARYLYFVFAVVALSLFSSLPFFAGLMMPDIFAAIMILVIFLLAFHQSDLARVERYYFILLLSIAVAVHLSNLTIAFGVVSIALLLHIWPRRTPLRSLATHATILLVPIGLATAAILLNNVVVHRTLSLFPAGPTFLLANMIEHGATERYLVETCPIARYKICAVIDVLPVTSGEFLWGPRLLQGLGGFEGMRGEATEIVRGVFKEHPLDLVRMAGYTISSTFIVHAPAEHLGALTRLRNWSDRWLVDIVERKFGPSAVSAYRSSFQSRDAIPRRLLRAIDNVTLPVAIVALMTAGLAAFHRRLREPTALAVVVALGFIINNAVCAPTTGRRMPIGPGGARKVG